jgi:hypothetical protein
LPSDRGNAVSAAAKRPKARKPVRYHLRFQILPGKHVQRDAATLAAFCRKHGVEEVVLFVASEEWNPGLLTAAQEDEWFKGVAAAKKVLERAGLSVSLNIWASVLHGGTGKKLPRGRGIKPMVSPTGEVNPAVASFADPAWRRYITHQYGRFARLGFRVLWIEDDFRYHNHRPLTWGGGFEEGMIRRFEKRLGRRVRREELVRNILRPGAPHPWRALWLATWREAQLEAAAAIAQAVRENAPGQSKVGLMSSGPAVHSTEGRDWGRLFEALSIDGQVAHRPHFRGAAMQAGREIARNIMMFDVQRRCQPDTAEIAPEIENYPFTRWGHSDSRTGVEMVLSLMFGSDALFLDLFPFAANPADQYPQIGQMLDECRPALEWTAARFDRQLDTRGVSLPYQFDTAQHVQTMQGKSMFELNVLPFQAGELLARYGVPVTFADGPVRALFGPAAWAFDDAEIWRLLGDGLMLDGAAAHILCQRGYGSMLGVDIPRIIPREQSDYSLEEVVADKLGVPRGHYMDVCHTAQTALLKPRRGAKVWTQILRPTGEHVCAGMVAFKNLLGGRVLTTSAIDPATSLHHNYQRQALWQSAVDFVAAGGFGSPTVTGGAHLVPAHFADRTRQFLAVFNECDDPAKPIIHLPVAPRGPITATLLAPLKKPQPVRVTARKRGRAATLESAAELPYLGGLVLEWKI